jgi:hypothetical protein
MRSIGGVPLDYGKTFQLSRGSRGGARQAHTRAGAMRDCQRPETPPYSISGTCTGRIAHNTCPFTPKETGTAETLAGVSVLEYFAPYIFVLRMSDTASPICELTGSTIQHFLGSDPKGKEYYSYWATASHPILRSYFDASSKSGEIFVLCSTGSRSKSKAIEFRALFLPVKEQDSRNTRFIGLSLASDGHATPTRSNSDVQQLQYIAFAPAMNAYVNGSMSQIVCRGY